LTDAGVLEANMLFATLDSTTRRLDLPEGRQITITDTVGFINKLPHGLVEAFKSTLDEVNEADLLLHVTDAGAHQREAQMQAVREVLAEIGAHAKPAVIVLNKADTITAEERMVLARRYPQAAFVSALRHEGVDELVTRISEEAARGSMTLSLLVPYTRGDLVQLVHERGQVLTERHTEEGTELVVRVAPDIAARLADFSVDGE
jgi:GTP-binding protein HflX